MCNRKTGSRVWIKLNAFLCSRFCLFAESGFHIFSLFKPFNKLTFNNIKHNAKWLTQQLSLVSLVCAPLRFSITCRWLAALRSMMMMTTHETMEKNRARPHYSRFLWLINFNYDLCLPKWLESFARWNYSANCLDEVRSREVEVTDRV